MFQYLTIPGYNALSNSQEERLRGAIDAKAIRAVWVHYVHLKKELPPPLQEILDEALRYGMPFDEKDQFARSLLGFVQRKPMFGGTSRVYYVTPRPGTISPWSSRATIIAIVLGFGHYVNRIERGMAIQVTKDGQQWKDDEQLPMAHLFHDRMTQTIGRKYPDPALLFREQDPASIRTVDVNGDEKSATKALEEANKRLGLALGPSEIEYLVRQFGPRGLAQNPTDLVLFMFAQVNSEHCRHKTFKAEWTIDGTRMTDGGGMPITLFEMIKSTHRRRPKNTVVAYIDNAAVFKGHTASVWAPSSTGEWTLQKEPVYLTAKVETHNHPTAVSPFPGAATGSGGEIRDEGAVGRGSKPKAGLTGYTVSDLLIPGHRRPWERDVGKPHDIASSLDIILQAPIGSAGFNNEFGRPSTTGFFRTLLTPVPMEDGTEEWRGYHKPIMIAGGVGTVRPQNAIKDARVVKQGAYVVVLGGPAMLIGLGGGATSSLASGETSADLDFASVQRGNPEMQRLAQNVIDACAARDDNPIAMIHDVGAGGLSNAIPELLQDAGVGGTIELRDIETADRGMSPMQIWCCEAQERYVMMVNAKDLTTFKQIAERERCPYSVVGRAVAGLKKDHRLVVTDRESEDPDKPVVDLSMSVLLGSTPGMTKTDRSRKTTIPPFDAGLTTYLPETPTDGLLKEAVNRVLTLPAVGSKSFLITIGDRSVGGLVVRDPMVGPWQVPVADVSVTATSLMPGITTGEAMATGERPTLAVISPAASARIAVVEALTNLGAADILDRLNQVILSANWMVASNHPGEGAALYEAVQAVAMDLCPKLNLSIPVGKDSMSMSMKWKDAKSQQSTEVTSPLSLVVTAFAPVRKIANTWTPALRRFEDVKETILLFVDLAEGMRALGGSALAQVFGQIGNEAPDVRSTQLIKDYFDALQQLHEAEIVLAYHDRSDGGLFTTLVEMMFAGRCGLDIMIDDLSRSGKTADIIEALFNEELGGVFQVRKKDETEFHRCFATCGPPPGLIKKIGRVPPKSKQRLLLQCGSTTIFNETRGTLQQQWASTSHLLQRLRDNPECADAEHAAILDDSDPGLSYQLKFRPNENVLPWKTTIPAALVSKPRVAILREQGINGHAEMAFAFHQAGFSAWDVHMTDIINGSESLASFRGLAACGGFSYGDVLGAGRGWALSVLKNKDVRKEFQHFFERKDTFTLGVCNGAQFLTRLQELIPGTQDWPTFEKNVSDQYEARLCMVEVVDPPSTSPPCVFLHGMHGSKLPVVVAHGEGRAVFDHPSSSTASTLRPSSSESSRQKSTVIRFISNTTSKPTEEYPFNPNGSKGGLTGVRSTDGRVLAMMPHPERMILKDAVSWAPSKEKEGWGGDLGPWGRLFLNARRWVG
ncbi:MAG: hypothetical protein M1823_001196 [Watsoniomyces obsoletus]|nr:MAG: hypothetical protein M1823_001196 [Watsoniomyces obsoletus]